MIYTKKIKHKKRFIYPEHKKMIYIFLHEYPGNTEPYPTTEKISWTYILP